MQLHVSPITHTRLALHCAALLIAAAAPHSAIAQPAGVAHPGDGAVARALDQRIDELKISGAPVSEALDEIGEEADVEIVIEPAAAALLPWGAETRVAEVNIRSATLREILDGVLAPLGMEHEIRDAAIRVVASAPLKRINRRAAWADLKLLQQIRQTPYSPDALSNFDVRYRITSKVDAKGMLADQLARAGRGSLADVLETATGSLGWVWFPDEDAIVIRSMQAQIANQLSRRVTMRCVNQPLAQVLMDLSNQAETAFVLEPGMMLKLPPQIVQSYSLVLHSTSIRQALELICAETGLKYDIQREVVRIGMSDALAQGGTPGGRRTMPYVGKIVVPVAGGKYSMEFLVREEDLPPDILDARRQMIEEAVQTIRQELAPPGETPTPGSSDR